jgi:hypothetical protein
LIISAAFSGGVALVRLPQRLVVDVLAGVAPGLDDRHDLGVAPHRPGTRPVVHLRLIAPPLQGQIQVAGEVAGIAGPGAAQRLDVRSQWLAFSARVSARNCGIQMCISSGASVSGAYRNSKVSLAMSCLVPVSVMPSAGEMQETAGPGRVQDADPW